MTARHYVALLRGINVGGRNLIRMTDLRGCLEDAGFGGVATYIQSGNVLFTAAGGAAALTPRIEALLASAFDYRATVVLRTREQMGDVVGRAPDGFGAEPDRYRYDVIFLTRALTAAAAVDSVPTKPGVDEVHAGDGVLYFSRLAEKATQSRLSRITALPIYPHMTVRNWNTTTKLLALLEARE